MKLKFIIGLAALLLAGTTAPAQTNTASTNNLSWFDSSATNWVAIPYLSYRLDKDQFGYGAAALYRVADYFWTGIRVQSLAGSQTTAGVQAQIQVSKTIFGVTVTPFLETSVGMGNSSLYGSVGPGGVINIYTAHWKWGGQPYNLGVGVVGDYEHVVNGNEHWNQVNAGPMFNLSFP